MRPGSSEKVWGFPVCHNLLRAFQHSLLIFRRFRQCPKLFKAQRASISIVLGVERWFSVYYAPEILCLRGHYGCWCLRCFTQLFWGPEALSIWPLCRVYMQKSNWVLSSSWTNGFCRLWLTLGKYLHPWQGGGSLVCVLLSVSIIVSISCPFFFSSVLSYLTLSHRCTHTHARTHSQTL